MRGEGKFVDDVDFLAGRRCGDRGIGVAIVANDFAGLGRVVDKLLAQRLRTIRGVGAFVPGDVERAAALHCGPGIVGENDDTAGAESALGDGIDRDHVANAGDGFGFRASNFEGLPPKTGQRAMTA